MTGEQPFRDVDWHLTVPRDRAFDDTIVSLVRPGEGVLDLGCGRGELLRRLRTERGVRDQGLEADGDAVAECIAGGLTVAQCDFEKDLASFPPSSFDLAIINQVLPLVRDPVGIISKALVAAGRVLVTFPNFAHWKVRGQLLFRGRLPLTSSLPYRWHETPHIRYFTVSDFRATCSEMGWRILSERHRSGSNGDSREIGLLPNLRASLSLFLLGS